jgi:hypothetical protein
LGVVIKDAARAHMRECAKDNPLRLQQHVPKPKSLARNDKTWMRRFVAVWKTERSRLLSLRPADKFHQTPIVFDLFGNNHHAVYKASNCQMVGRASL